MLPIHARRSGCMSHRQLYFTLHRYVPTEHASYHLNSTHVFSPRKDWMDGLSRCSTPRETIFFFFFLFRLICRVACLSCRLSRGNTVLYVHTYICHVRGRVSYENAPTLLQRTVRDDIHDAKWRSQSNIYYLPRYILVRPWYWEIWRERERETGA